MRVLDALSKEAQADLDHVNEVQKPPPREPSGGIVRFRRMIGSRLTRSMSRPAIGRKGTSYGAADLENASPQPAAAPDADGAWT